MNTQPSPTPPSHDEVEHVSRHNFRVMGTSAELLLRADDSVAAPVFAAAERELNRLNDTLTRFDPRSELEQLNNRGHGMVGPELRTLLDAALLAYEETDGRFNIGVGADLIAAGYDRTFDDLDHNVDNTPDAAGQAPATPTSGDTRTAATSTTHSSGFTVDASGLVSLRPGVRLDLGGIAKGWASDHICAGLAQKGSCIVNLGGDIALHVADGDEPWPVGVDLGGGESISIAVQQGGLATSGQDRRVWRTAENASPAHHVIDPRTSAPAVSDIKRITVFSDSCMHAEIWAKALLIVGRDEAKVEANRRGLTTIIIDIDDHSYRTGSLAE